MIDRDDIICTDKFLNIASNNIIYLKTDLLAHGLQKINWRNNEHVLHPGKVWITGHSDYPIDRELFNKYEKNCEVWFAINKNVENSKIIGIPLGITNNTCESHLHPIYGNLDIMVEVMQMPKDIKNLVYMNFNICTFKVERQMCYDMFCSKQWVTKGTINNTVEGRKDFLIEIRNHKFVLCPRGNGIDTHRLWETLYMGSIPIVKRCSTINEFADLPILFIDEWSDLTIELLEEKYAEIIGKTWNMEKLKFSYWKKIINEYAM